MPVSPDGSDSGGCVSCWYPAPRISRSRRGPEDVDQCLAVADDRTNLVGSGHAEADDDEVELRTDEYALAKGAAAVEEPEAARDDPEMRAVETVRLRRRRARVVDPSLGQDALAIPHPVAQIEVAEAGEVAGTAIATARSDEVSGGVEAWVGRRHADAIEELALHEGTHLGRVRVERLAHEAREQVAGAAVVVPARLGLGLIRQGGSEGRDVILP